MTETLPTDRIYINGLNGASGEYLLPPMTPAQVSALAQGQPLDEDEIADLQQRAFDLNNPNAGVEADARELSETGWGVIFAADSGPEIYEALQPLLQLRQKQAGERYKEYRGSDGYRPGETKDGFLTRHGMGPGPVNPEKVPYYLLIVGDPESIPFRFQYQMDVQYAVGRIHFENGLDYAHYAQSIVAAETGLSLAPHAVFFGAANPDDRATQMSSEYLVQPLAQKIIEEQPRWLASMQKARAFAGLDGPAPTWEVQTVVKEAATRQGLSDLLNGPRAPALLFTASHGIGFPSGHPLQEPHQGGLVCQDWPGPQLWRGPLPEEQYFSGDKLSGDANLLGTLAFFFACYGAGTPRQDEFARQVTGGQPQSSQIAPRDFIAGLPQRMLSLPRGGAQAVVGHIERAWGNSFFWGRAGQQLQVFKDCFERLIKGGYPIGYAMEVFNNRYAELSSDLSSELKEINDHGLKPDDQKLASLWTASNDARNYVILGDPASRLAVGRQGGKAAARPLLPEIQAHPAPAMLPAELPAAQSQAGMPLPGEEDYGLIDSLKEAQASLGSSLNRLFGKLSDTLTRALDDVTTLEVATYISENLPEVKYENGKFSGANLRALTRIKLDGDTLVCLPEDRGEVDKELWEIHSDAVHQAQESRAELLKTAISAASQLVNLVKS